VAREATCQISDRVGPLACARVVVAVLHATLLACLLASAAVAQSGDSDRARLEDPFEITADRIDYDGERDLYVATGNVYVIQTARTLRAEWIAFSTETGIGVAEGDVELVDVSDVVTAEFMFFDVESLRGMFLDGGIDAGSQGFRIRAKEMIRTGEHTFEMKDAVFTTCRCPDDGRLPWQITSQEAEVEVGDYGTVKNATLDVLGIPVLWFPWAFFPVKSDRESGVLLPDVSLGGRGGYGGGLPLFWAAHQQVNVLFTPRYFSERGFKGDGEIEYVFGERSEGELFVSGLFDQLEGGSTKFETRQTRYGVKWRHDQDLFGGWRWQTDLKHVSDNFYPDDFPEFRRFREFRFLESTTNAHRDFGESGGVGAMVGARYAEDVQGIRLGPAVTLTDPPPGPPPFPPRLPTVRGPDLVDADATVLQRFGEAALDVQPATAVAPGGVQFLLDAEVVHFRAIRNHEEVLEDQLESNPSVVDGHFYDIGADGITPQGVPGADGTPFDAGAGNGVFDPGEPIRERGVRAVIHPRLSRPVSFGRFGSFTPEIGWRQSLYRTDQQQFGERGLITARAEWRNQLVRDFDLEKGRKLRHIIEPRVGWAYVSARQQDRNPLFTPSGVVEQSRLRTLSLESITRDPSDRIEAANRVVVGVGQRFWRRRHARAPLRFTGELLTAVDWDFAEGGLGNVLLDGRLMPTGPISARAVLAFDPEAAAVDEGGVDLLFQRRLDLFLMRRLTINAGYRYRRMIPPVLESNRGIVEIGELGAVNQIIGRVGVELTSRFRVRYASVYKLAERDEFIRNEVTVEYVSKCRCWSIGATVGEDRRDQIRGGLMFRFIGLGDGDGKENLFDSGFGTGVRF